MGRAFYIQGTRPKQSSGRSRKDKAPLLHKESYQPPQDNSRTAYKHLQDSGTYMYSAPYRLRQAGTPPMSPAKRPDSSHLFRHASADRLHDERDQYSDSPYRRQLQSSTVNPAVPDPSAEDLGEGGSRQRKRPPSRSRAERRSRQGPVPSEIVHTESKTSSELEAKTPPQDAAEDKKVKVHDGTEEESKSDDEGTKRSETPTKERSANSSPPIFNKDSPPFVNGLLTEEDLQYLQQAPEDLQRILATEDFTNRTDEYKLLLERAKKSVRLKEIRSRRESYLAAMATEYSPSGKDGGGLGGRSPRGQRRASRPRKAVVKPLQHEEETAAPVPDDTERTEGVSEAKADDKKPLQDKSQEKDDALKQKGDKGDDSVTTETGQSKEEKNMTEDKDKMKTNATFGDSIWDEISDLSEVSESVSSSTSSLDTVIDTTNDSIDQELQSLEEEERRAAEIMGETKPEKRPDPETTIQQASAKEIQPPKDEVEMKKLKEKICKSPTGFAGDGGLESVEVLSDTSSETSIESQNEVTLVEREKISLEDVVTSSTANNEQDTEEDTSDRFYAEAKKEPVATDTKPFQTKPAPASDETECFDTNGKSKSLGDITSEDIHCNKFDSKYKTISKSFITKKMREQKRFSPLRGPVMPKKPLEQELIKLTTFTPEERALPQPTSRLEPKTSTPKKLTFSSRSESRVKHIASRKRTQSESGSQDTEASSFRRTGDAVFVLTAKAEAVPRRNRPPTPPIYQYRHSTGSYIPGYIEGPAPLLEDRGVPEGACSTPGTAPDIVPMASPQGDSNLLERETSSPWQKLPRQQIVPRGRILLASLREKITPTPNKTAKEATIST
ncbi:1-phosphatidylinositol 4,5-bisphosphate phosphodiesterase [Branchiostoma belcheri]|nr:1-phosphatidylinositol 4,5-bisphosphate phosphodiesterase [Branchiostoma belcheri]